MYDKEKVIGVALGEVGYQETPVNITKYAEYLDAIPSFYNGKKNGYAWCDVFVDWCFVTAYGVEAAKKLLCQPDNSLGAGCLYSAQYYKEHGQFHTGLDVQTGDQIFFSYQPGEVSHTGIVVELFGDRVIAVEGNTSDGVYKRVYERWDSKIYGYGRPDWSIGGDGLEPQEGDSTIIVDTPVNGTSGNAADSAESQAQNSHSAEIDGNGTSGSRATALLPVLRKGDGVGNPSEIVRAAQLLLIGRGFGCGHWGADGEFGEATYGALYQFQRARGIAVDGVLGPESWGKLLGIE